MRSDLLCSLALATVILSTSSGCQFGPNIPVINSTEAMTAATGESVEFRTEEPPLDEATVTDVSTLMLSDAVRLAVRADLKLQAALAQVRIAHSESLQTRLLPNPVLSVAVRFPSSGASIIEASLSDELTSLLSRPAKIGAADARLRAAAADALTEVLDVIAEVQEHYVAAQAAEQVIALLDERRILTGRLLSVSEARLQTGEGTRSDVLAVQFKQSEVDIEIAEQKRQGRRERLAVARLIGRPSDIATWTLSPPPEPPDLLTTEAQWIAAALKNRPEVASVSWELSALGYDRRAANLLPFDGLEAGVESERDGDWSMGPAASIPLPVFDWGQASRASADARILQARHRLTESRRRVVQEVRQALNDYRESAATLHRVRSDLVSLATRRREQAEAAYRLGLADLTDVLLADEELQSAKVRAVELTKDLIESKISLERAAGGAARAPASTQLASPTQPTTSTGARP